MQICDLQCHPGSTLCAASGMGRGRVFFFLSLWERGKCSGMGKELGKVSSLWPACPGSPCAALRGKVAELSLWWHPRRDAQGQA